MSAKLPPVPGASKAMSGNNARGNGVPSKKGKKKKNEPPQEVFTHFTLNKDPECSKYMPYDEVAYPRLPVAGSAHAEAKRLAAQAEMETMWLQGFLDHTQQNEDTAVAKSIAPFLDMPGSHIFPTAQTELRRLERLRKRGENKKGGEVRARGGGVVRAGSKRAPRAPPPCARGV